MAQVLKPAPKTFIFFQMNMGLTLIVLMSPPVFLLFSTVCVLTQQRLIGSQSQAQTGRDATHSNYYYEEEVFDGCAVAHQASFDLERPKHVLHAPKHPDNFR